jgi:hypothetical protein
VAAACKIVMYDFGSGLPRRMNANGYGSDNIDNIMPYNTPKMTTLEPTATSQFKLKMSCCSMTAFQKCFYFFELGNCGYYSKI